MLNIGDKFVRIETRIAYPTRPHDTAGYEQVVRDVHTLGITDERGVYHGFTAVKKVEPSPQCQIKELENQIERLKQSLIEVGKTYGVATVLGTHGDYVWIKNQGAVPITLSRQNFFDRYLKDKHCD